MTDVELTAVQPGVDDHVRAHADSADVSDNEEVLATRQTAPVQYQTAVGAQLHQEALH